MKKLLLMLLLATGTILSARITSVTFFPADWLGKQYNFLEGYPSTLVLQFLGHGKELAAAPPTAVAWVHCNHWAVLQPNSCNNPA